MKKLIILALGLVALFAANALAGDFEYVGATKCKGCHKAQFTSWSETAHAKSFDVLSDEEKKDAKCVGCHTTGTTAKEELLEGAQCEACHGPGSAYKSPKIMGKKLWAADRDAAMKGAMEAGLLVPDEKVCVKCHTKEGNENFKPFDYAKVKGTVHPAPAEEAAKEAAPKKTE